MKSAMKREEIKVTETVIGIDLIYSPMMPEAESKGRKAQTVVSVVVKSTTLKSFNTKSTASSGVNLPELRYCLVALTTTMASSTKRPRDRMRENRDKKFKLVPVMSMTPKVAKNTSGIAKPATKASFKPTIKNNTANTSTTVSKKSWVS